MQSTLYLVVLTIHSVLRWVVLLTGLFAIIRAITGISFRRGWMAMDNNAGLWFTIVFDIQVLVGFILYLFLSPTTTSALLNFGNVMANPTARFFTLEHITIMIIALAFAHIGRGVVRRAPTAIQKHRRALIWFSLALLLVLLAIPWPFLSYGRPLI